jgi:hypothetical protein
MNKACRHEWREKVELFLDIPLSISHRLNKQALRSREVKIEGANWAQVARLLREVRKDRMSLDHCQVAFEILRGAKNQQGCDLRRGVGQRALRCAIRNRRVRQSNRR